MNFRYWVKNPQMLLQVACLITLSFSVSSSGAEHPRLYISKATLPAFKAKFQTPFGTQIRAKLDRLLDKDTCFAEKNPGCVFHWSYATVGVGHAVRYLLDKDPYDLFAAQWAILYGLAVASSGTPAYPGIPARSNTSAHVLPDFTGWGFSGLGGFSKISAVVALDLIYDDMNPQLRTKILGWLKQSVELAAREPVTSEWGDSKVFAMGSLSLMTLKGEVEDTWFNNYAGIYVQKLDSLIIRTGEHLWDTDYFYYDEMADGIFMQFGPFMRLSGKTLKNEKTIREALLYFLMTNNFAMTTRDCGMNLRDIATLGDFTTDELKPVYNWFIQNVHPGFNFAGHVITLMNAYDPNITVKKPNTIMPKMLYSTNGGFVFRPAYSDSFQNDPIVILNLRSESSHPALSAGELCVFGYGANKWNTWEESMNEAQRSRSGTNNVWVGNHYGVCGFGRFQRSEVGFLGAPCITRVQQACAEKGAIPIYASFDEVTGSGIVKTTIPRYVYCAPEKATKNVGIEYGAVIPGLNSERHVAVDMSKKSGADVLIAVVDRVFNTGDRKTGQQWHGGAGYHGNGMAMFFEGDTAIPSGRGKAWPWGMDPDAGDFWRTMIQHPIPFQDTTALFQGFGKLPRGKSVNILAGDQWPTRFPTKEQFETLKLPTLKYTYIGEDYTQMSVRQVSSQMSENSRYEFRAVNPNHEYFTIITMQKGKGPNPRVISGSGLNSKVQVGDQIVSFNGTRLVLGNGYNGKELALGTYSGTRTFGQGDSRKPVSFSSANKPAAYYNARGQRVAGIDKREMIANGLYIARDKSGKLARILGSNIKK